MRAMAGILLAGSLLPPLLPRLGVFRLGEGCLSRAWAAASGLCGVPGQMQGDADGSHSEQVSVAWGVAGGPPSPWICAPKAPKPSKATKTQPDLVSSLVGLVVRAMVLQS